MATQDNIWNANVYDDLSSLGLFMTKLVVIIMGCLSVILLYGAVVLAYTDDEKDFIRVRGRVIKSTCTKIKEKEDDYKCITNIEYVVDNKTYTRELYMSGSSNYISGEPIELMVASTDHASVQVAYTNKTVIATYLVGGAFITTGLAYLNMYLANNYKIFSAGRGVGALFGMII